MVNLKIRKAACRRN